MDVVLAPLDSFTDKLFVHRDVFESWTLAGAAVAVYAVAVAIAKFLPFKPFHLKAAMQYHNLILFVMSVAFVVMGLVETARSVARIGAISTYCATKDSSMWSSGMWFWCLLFYYSKFYEFLDTAFIVLRKKPLLLLHFYHHLIVVPYCVLYMKESMVFFVNGVISNGLIHSFMYYSYYQQSRGVSVPWKKYLTAGQIFQFVWGIATFLPWPAVCGYSYGPSWAGPTLVWYFHLAVLISFIFLFYQFFQTRYSEDVDGRGSPGPARLNGQHALVNGDRSSPSAPRAKKTD